MYYRIISFRSKSERLPENTPKMVNHQGGEFTFTISSLRA
nr:MAG TPA: hypothetical protein [Caudoviricetes sp.]